MTLKARLARLEARLWPRSLAEFPASQLWLGLLECAEQLFFAEGPPKVRKRLRDGIAFLQGYVARRQLGAQVEQLCEECRTSWIDRAAQERLRRLRSPGATPSAKTP